MPDIQAGEKEMTAEEAASLKKRIYEASDNISGVMRVDELGEPHDESAYNHLGRS